MFYIIIEAQIHDIPYRFIIRPPILSMFKTDDSGRNARKN